jgi:hypothetical protein
MVADLRALHEQTHRSPFDLVIGDSASTGLRDFSCSALRPVDLTAAQALVFPAIQLFVERASSGKKTAIDIPR